MEEHGLLDQPVCWEVCVLRLLIRKAPDLQAPVQGICHEQELLFEEPHGAPDDWLCLHGHTGYVLKDGRRKDAKLGMLVKPFKLEGVPEAHSTSVLLILKEGWQKARSRPGGLPLLRPNAVKRLRKAHEEAVSLASQDMEFRLDIFESEYQKGVDAVNSEQGFLAQARMLLQKSEMAAMQGSKRYQARLGVKKDSVQRWIEGIKERILPNQADATEVVSKALELLKKEENMVKLQVQVGCTVHVVGDLHGQFWDLLHLLEMCGDPSPRNQYLFNGDFVDRGQFSVEVAFLLLALKVLYPRSVHLNRGNHEALRMNALYGFQHETENKYGNELFRLFSEAFKHLPLCTLVNSAVFVVHGGLSSKEGVKLSDLARVNRLREPDETAEQLMLDLLWSDPMDSPGFCTSPRGGGILFGPDVTKRFCEENGLCCIIRSHEMKSEGYEWQHMNRCLTIFSAPWSSVVSF
ncbi:Serine/threonine-protein phosphatase T (PPT) [Durusdinium trenchii]|uniref:Serine/threonine-protein phosphatase n=1 Tax=Durusdinium trenchii TaxID=1381693 RepID=A0ABP0L2Y4_9DINO